MKKLMVLLGIAAAIVFIGIIIGLIFRISKSEKEDVPIPKLETKPGESATSLPSTGGSGRDSNPTPEAPEETPSKPRETPEDKPSKGITVVVTDGESGNLLPGATVRILDMTDFSWSLYEIEEVLRYDTETLLAKHGQELLTDEAGKVALPAFEDRARICARHEALWNRKDLKAPVKETVRLPLFPDKVIRVQVVDLAGKPVGGIPLRILHRPFREMMPTTWKILGYGVTAEPDGIARFLNLDREVDDLQVHELEATSAIPHPSPPFVKVNARRPSEKPYRLQLPQTGRVVVNVRNPDGTPFLLEAKATIRLLLERSQPFMGNTEWFFRPLPVTVRGGKAVFPHVGVGSKFRVQVSGPERDWKPAILESDGVLVPGGEIVLTVSLGSLYPVFTCRILDSRGKVLADRSMLVIQSGYSESRSCGAGGQVKTDGEGRLRVVLLTDQLPRNAVRRQLYVKFRGEEPAVGRLTEQTAILELPDAIQAGKVTDLGDIVLADSPLLVSGKVVDDAGVPVPGVRITIKRVFKSTTPPGPVRSVEEDEFIEILEIHSDREGRFEVNVRTPTPEFSLDAEKEGFLDFAPVPFSRGEKNLAVKLRRAGAISGRLMLPEGIQASRFGIRILREEESDRTGRNSGFAPSIHPKSDGSFRCGHLAPGTVTVQIVLGDGWKSKPLVVLENVRIKPGEESRDPRLDAIDLRNRVRRIEVEVVDRNGMPLPGALVDSPRDQSLSGYTDREGKVMLLAANLSVDLGVQKPDFRKVLIKDVGAFARVVLVRGIPVKIVLVCETSLPFPPIRVTCSLFKHFDPSFQGVRKCVVGSRVDFGPSGEALMYASEPCRFTVDLSLREKTERVEKVVSLRSRGEDIIEVKDSDAAQTFRVHLSAGDLREALKSLRE